MISIIIPVYNQAQKLAKALDSIEKQDYKDWEVIIVNDGSSDDPEKTFSQFSLNTKAENRFLFLSQENQGAPAARNRGLVEAKGEYVLFCDADAVLVTSALYDLLSVLESIPEASYAYPSFLWGKKLFKVGSFDEEKLKTGPYIHTMALIRKDALPTPAWDENIKKFQDWDLWLRMLAENKTGVWLDKVLFTITPGGTISSWLPSFAYKLLPFLPAVKKYQKAMAIIKQKHGLS
jgi:glycosyltransferase involved in cell wall biosynthesis